MDEVHGGVIQDDHLGGHAQETFQVRFEIQRKVTEGGCRRPRRQHPDVDIARRAGGAARDAAEQIGRRNLGRPALEESAQPMIDDRGVHWPDYSLRSSWLTRPRPGHVGGDGTIPGGRRPR